MSLPSVPNLPDLTNKGDFAVFGLGYALGFGADVILFGAKSGPPPLTVALIFAIAFLAIKSAYEAWVREWLRAVLSRLRSGQSDISEDDVAREEMQAHLDAFAEFLQVGREFTTTVNSEWITLWSDEGERAAQEILRRLWEFSTDPREFSLEEVLGRAPEARDALRALNDSVFVSASPAERTRVKVTIHPLETVVVVERREPNPNYSPQTAQEDGELPYLEHRETVDVWIRYWMLRALWERGLLTNEYVETHLSNLIDLVCRNAQNVGWQIEQQPEETQTPQQA
jgi:hypothetical protein